MTPHGAHFSSVDGQDSDPARARPARSSTFINHRQVRNIIHGTQYAERRGRPLNCFVTLNFGHATCDVQAVSKTFERLRDNHYTKWLRDTARRDAQPQWLPPFYVWAVEDKPGHPNVHWLLHVPDALRARFEAKLDDWLEHLAGPLDRPQRPIHVENAPTPLGAMKYLAKGIDPRYAHLYRISAKPQGLVFGKRAGLSKALGPAAIARTTIVDFRSQQARTSLLPMSRTRTDP